MEEEASTKKHSGKSSKKSTKASAKSNSRSRATAVAAAAAQSESESSSESDSSSDDEDVVTVSAQAAKSPGRGGKAKGKKGGGAPPNASPVRRRRSATKQLIAEAPKDVRPRSRKPTETFSPPVAASGRQPRGVRSSAPQKIEAPPKAAQAATPPQPAIPMMSAGGGTMARDLPPPAAGRQRAGKAAYVQDELTVMVQWVKLCTEQNELVLKPRGNKMWHVARALGLLTGHSQQSLWTKWKSTFHNETEYWLSRSWAAIVPPGLPDGIGEFLVEIQSATPIPTVQDAYELFLQGLPGWAALMNPKRSSKAAAARKPRASPKRKAAAASSAAAAAEAARVQQETDAIEDEEAAAQQEQEEEEDLLPPVPAAHRAGRGASIASPGRGKKRGRGATARAASALGKKARSEVAASPARSPKRVLSQDEVANTLAQEIGVTVEQAAGVLTATGGDYEMAATMLQVMVQKR